MFVFIWMKICGIFKILIGTERFQLTTHLDTYKLHSTHIEVHS
jgi:hypothetical protein